ncbi:MAG: hypothetical protein LKJ17_06625 [Oscillospiraceae bacterium]|jgi:PTS system ascorbate-specific IIB component|nr:hypothetical protein [Oscillospiraceae bacterium]
MLNLLCVCGNGMGTSTLLKITVREVCEELKIDADVDSCSAGEAPSYMMQTDMILTAPEWAEMLTTPPNVVMCTSTNLIDKKIIREMLEKTVKEHFPDELG